MVNFDAVWLRSWVGCRRRQFHSVCFPVGSAAAGLRMGCIHSWDLSLHHNIVLQTCGSQNQSGLSFRVHFRRRIQGNEMYYYLLKRRCSAGMHGVNELGPLVCVVTGCVEGFLLMSQLETPALIISHTGVFFGNPLNNARLGLFRAQLRPVPAAPTPLRLNGTHPKTCEESLRH